MALCREAAAVQELRKLDLSENYLHDLPEELGRLSKLQVPSPWSLVMARAQQLGVRGMQRCACQVLRLEMNKLHVVPPAVGRLQALQVNSEVARCV